MKKFIDENKFEILLTLIVVLLCHGRKMLSRAFSIDTEILMVEPQLELSENATSSRPALLWFKYVFNNVSFNSYIGDFLCILFLFLAIVCLGYFISRVLGESESGYMIIFATVTMTNPIITEQISFNMQNAEIGLGILMSVVAGYFLFQFGCTKHWLNLIPAIICSSICFCEYQAFLALVISFTIFFFFIQFGVKKEEISVKDGLSSIARSIVAYIVSFLIYQFIVNVFYEKSSYISSQSFWGNDSIVSCIKRIVKSVISILRGDTIFHSGWMGLLFVVFLASLFWLNRKKSLLSIIVSLGLLLAPFLMIIVIGGQPQSYRAEFDMILSFGLIITSIMMIFREDRIHKVSSEKLVLSIVAVLISLLAFSQFGIIERLYYADESCFENDVYMARTIGNEIKSIQIENGNKDYPVYISGRYHYVPNSGGIVGEAMGVSFFGWCDGVDWHNKRSLYFMNTQGYPFGELTKEEYEDLEARNIARDMPIWPAEGSISLIDDVIVVKLNELD